MADNETIADIIAWLRRPREGENAYLTLWRDEIADRIEAAWKRERGDCAKLREALEELVANIEMRSSTFGLNVMVDTKTDLDAKAALAEPILNYEVGTAGEQTVRFAEFCKSHIHSDLPKCAGCPLEDIPDGTGCAQAWAQMPYESEAKK